MADDRTSSMIEVAAIKRPAARYDVAILGGGLAGLTLALQLSKSRPQTSIAVLEKREGPAPQAAFKVGESTVAIGGDYFANKVGLKDHLVEHQLRKAGLRFFCPAGDNSDITRRIESGPPLYPPHDTFQIDRGLFENELASRARAAGVDVLQGARVQEVELGEDTHEVGFDQFGQRSTLQARWVVDAAGRSAIMKRKLGLSKDVGHTINSAWLRLGGGLDFEQWGAEDDAWMGRMFEHGIRQFSTNHLTGEGYWVWLIPLATGPISIGVCADPRFHPFEEIGELDAFLDWLDRHEPQLAAAIRPRTDDIQDFLRVKDFAYGVERMISTDRWALVGEAAAFADPFLSPGSDMIALSNTIAAGAIERDLDGQEIDEHVAYYGDLYQRTFAHVLSRTEDFYPVFANPWVASAKFGWDAYMSACGVVLPMISGRLSSLELMRRADEDIDRAFRLNINMHALMREWHQLEVRDCQDDFHKVGVVAAVRANLNAVSEQFDDDDALLAKLSQQVSEAEAIAVAIFFKAAAALPEPPSEDLAVNPYKISLRPQDWEADGALSQPALTLAQAHERVPDIGWMFLDYVPPSG
jgi:flavin-dependent dehydrogenase